MKQLSVKVELDGEIKKIINKMEDKIKKLALTHREMEDKFRDLYINCLYLLDEDCIYSNIDLEDDLRDAQELFGEIG